VVEHLRLGAWMPAFGFAQRVDEHVQWSARGNTRVELANRPGGAVARVRKQWLTRRGALVVDLLKGRARQVHLAAYLEVRRRLRGVVECERHASNRAQVRRDVLAAGAVAAGSADRKPTLLVAEHDRQAINFRLDREVAHFATDQPRDPLVP